MKALARLAVATMAVEFSQLDFRPKLFLAVLLAVGGVGLVKRGHES